MNPSPAGMPAPNSSTVPAPVDPGRLSGLRRYNLVVGLILIVQAVVVLVLSNGFTLPVTASYLEGPPGTPAGRAGDPVEHPGGVWQSPASSHCPDVALLIVATVWHTGYAADLARTRNRARWVEYALTSSMMIVLIAQLTGITDVAALAAIFAVNAAMIFFGWLQEDYESPGGGWLPFIFGCIVGIVPWLIIAFFVVSPGSASAAPPRASSTGSSSPCSCSSTCSRSTSSCSTSRSADGPTTWSASARTSR